MLPSIPPYHEHYLQRVLSVSQWRVPSSSTINSKSKLKVPLQLCTHSQQDTNSRWNICRYGSVVVPQSVYEYTPLIVPLPSYDAIFSNLRGRGDRWIFNRDASWPVTCSGWVNVKYQTTGNIYESSKQHMDAELSQGVSSGTWHFHLRLILSVLPH